MFQRGCSNQNAITIGTLELGPNCKTLYFSGFTMWSESVSLAAKSSAPASGYSTKSTKQLHKPQQRRVTIISVISVIFVLLTIFYLKSKNQDVATMRGIEILADGDSQFLVRERNS